MVDTTQTWHSPRKGTQAGGGGGGLLSETVRLRAVEDCPSVLRVEASGDIAVLGGFASDRESIAERMCLKSPSLVDHARKSLSIRFSQIPGLAWLCFSAFFTH